MITLIFRLSIILSLLFDIKMQMSFAFRQTRISLDLLWKLRCLPQAILSSVSTNQAGSLYCFFSSATILFYLQLKVTSATTKCVIQWNLSFFYSFKIRIVFYWLASLCCWCKKKNLIKHKLSSVTKLQERRHILSRLEKYKHRIHISRKWHKNLVLFLLKLKLTFASGKRKQNKAISGASVVIFCRV